MKCCTKKTGTMEYLWRLIKTWVVLKGKVRGYHLIDSSRGGWSDNAGGWKNTRCFYQRSRVHRVELNCSGPHG